MMGGIFAEIVNILVLTQSHTATHCLEHFVAFELLTTVDNIYLDSLEVCPIRDELKTPLELIY